MARVYRYSHVGAFSLNVYILVLISQDFLFFLIIAASVQGVGLAEKQKKKKRRVRIMIDTEETHS